jgi:hypothetical protein
MNNAWRNFQETLVLPVVSLCRMSRDFAKGCGGQWRGKETGQGRLRIVMKMRRKKIILSM